MAKKAQKSKKLPKLWLLLIGIVLVVAFYFYHIIFTQKKVDYTLMVKKGDTVTSVANLLVGADIIDSKNLFKIIVRYTGNEKKIVTGVYKLNGNLSLYDISQRLISGNPDMIQVTFIEGWNFKQIREVLNKNNMLTHVTESMTDDQIKTRLNINEEKVEGFIYPSTYFVAPYQSDLDVLNLAYKTMINKLNIAWDNRESGLPYKSPYQLLIMASLVQKEVAESQSMQKVATVFKNRLKKGMKLQDDPAVFYGLDNKAVIVRADFKIDTPYNTYLHSGLTPTPICSPGENALYAAGHPLTDNNLLYFIATKDGQTIFTDNFVEHSKAVDKYLRNK